MVQSGDGSIWFAIGDDQGCPAVNAADGGVLARSIGVRRLLSDLDGCKEPAWSEPDCFYASMATPEQGVLEQPGTDARWPVVLSAAEDSGRIGLSVQLNRDSGSGGPCLPSSTNCHADAAYIVRRDDGNWCDVRGVCQGGHVFEDILSLSAWSTANGGPVTDHLMPTLAMLDDGRLGISWYDFRDSSSETTYQVFVGTARIPDFPDLSRATAESRLLPTVGHYYSPEVRELGEIDLVRGSRLHAHWARRFIPIGCANQLDCRGHGAVTSLWAPRSPPF